MSGGLLNLVAEGANNVFIMGNPTKTFFRTTYAKHTNFGLQKFRIDYDGQRDLRLTEPSMFSFKIPRYGDLLMDTYLVINLPDIYSPIYAPCADTNYKWAPYEFQWIHDLGSQMLQEVEITCGHMVLARFSGDYLRNMVERDFLRAKKDLFYRMTGNIKELHDPANIESRNNAYPSAYYTESSLGAEPSIRGRTLYIPLNVWFTLNSTMAIPLVALQYNEMHINVTLRPIQQLFRVRDVFDPYNYFPYVAPDFTQQQFQFYRFLQTPPGEQIRPQDYGNQSTQWNADVHLLATYCFLSEDEARQFAASPHAYLVKDVMEYTFENISGTKRLELGSSGMVSSWMFYLQRNDVNLRNEWSNYTNWPYSNLPFDVQFAPATSQTIYSFVMINPLTGLALTTGPMFDLSGTATNIYVTGNFNAANNKNILMTMGILLDGNYRENALESGVFEYVEKYTRSQGDCPDGLYCYNFCLNTNPIQIQPSGAINMSCFHTVEMEVTTFLPTIDTTAAANYMFVCDACGNYVGLSKQNWRLFEYTYNCKIMEERYNILYFENGNAGMMYAR